jgi:hypothetical protein
LRGGKGVPDSVIEHPAVFMTLTAPSFGLVHTQGAGGRCRPRRDAPYCPHGVRLSCGASHEDGDPCLGEPLCMECFDHTAAVVWNNTVGELWRYTTIYVPRALAREAEMTQEALKREVRPAYVKVAEYQRRGLMHLHVLARLDRAMPKYRADEIKPPPARYTGELLERAMRGAIGDVSAPVLDELGGGRVSWGGELDVRVLETGEQRGEIAGYLAKYATKSTEQAGGLLHRVDPAEVDRAPVREHVRRYMRAAFELQAKVVEQRKRTRVLPAPRPVLSIETDWNPSALALRARRAVSRDEVVRVRLDDGSVHVGRSRRITATGPEHHGTTLALAIDGATVHLGDVASIGPAQAPRKRRDRRDPRLAACAHAFGYRGHCLTKSRRYSTTFKSLREARYQHVLEQLLARSRDETQRALAEAEERVSSFRFVGQGHITAADAFLAASAAARAREYRQLAREARDDELMAVHGGASTGRWC